MCAEINSRIDRLFCLFCAQYPKYRYYENARILLYNPGDKWQMCANLYDALPALAGAKRLIERRGTLHIDCGGDLGFTLRFGIGAGQSLNNVEYFHFKSSRRAVIIEGIRHDIVSATYSANVNRITTYFDRHFKQLVSFINGPGIYCEYLFKASRLSNGMLLYKDMIITTDCGQLNIGSARYYSEEYGTGEYLHDGHTKINIEGYTINVCQGKYINNDEKRALDFGQQYAVWCDIFKHFGVYIGRFSPQFTCMELMPRAVQPKPTNTKPAARDI